ncbi:MAG TPA: SUF system NifU family Fe-S cluster assembly protein [Anaerolineales bacterium]|nr:SUF system NifU family Fe-S cluster assembly protein [Anaerolineales bacterium]HRF49116.1 SUF system NifU family Fe-S cluster assembly protein [Anaerolineales bacterium]
MDDFYRELILDHNKNPRFRGTLDPYTFTYEDENPLCGDKLRIDVRLDETGHVAESAFTGRGCAISQASASLLMEKIQGASLDELRALSKDDVLELLGIELTPARLKCALLSLKVLKAGAYGLSDDTLPDA